MRKISSSLARFSFAVMFLCAFTAFSSPAFAVEPDTCKKQRATFPRQWSKVKGERLLMKCYAKYVRVSIHSGLPDAGGKRVISLTAGTGKAARVFRTWVDRVTFLKLLRGRPVPIFLQSENSCFIRGNMNGVVYFKAGLKGGDVLVRGEHNLLTVCETP